MFNPFELFELLDLLSGKKQKPGHKSRPTSVVGGFLFGLTGAVLGAKLASKVEAGLWIWYGSMIVAAVVGFFVFVTLWRRVLG